MAAFGTQIFPSPPGNNLHYYVNPYEYANYGGYCSNYRFQDFDYFVVIDFEATCDKVKIPNPQEIIEFPAVIVNGATGQLVSTFQRYVRPTCNQELSNFCKHLTGIEQGQVDKGITLAEALVQFDQWLETTGIKKTQFAIVTWSDWDCKVMLESECRYKKLKKPAYFDRWINLRVPFHEVFGARKCNLKGAVEIAGLNWLGRQHCGLDDAMNTACLLVRLMQMLMQMGLKLSITGDLTKEPPPEQLVFRKQQPLMMMMVQKPVLVNYQPSESMSSYFY